LQGDRGEPATASCGKTKQPGGRFEPTAGPSHDGGLGGYSSTAAERVLADLRPPQITAARSSGSSSSAMPWFGRCRSGSQRPWKRITSNVHAARVFASGGALIRPLPVCHILRPPCARKIAHRKAARLACPRESDARSRGAASSSSRIWITNSRSCPFGNSSRAISQSARRASWRASSRLANSIASALAAIVSAPFSSERKRGMGSL
jgi:hypothetical protein